MKITSLFAAVAVAGVTMTTAAAQSDSCSTATAIAGQGTFPYDTSLATTGLEGQLEGLCYFFGNSAIDNDVWFSWTADATGNATVQTCNNSGTDTKLAAYPGGGCPTAGTALACNDDSCGLQSLMTFPVTNGTAYMLQAGNFPGAAGGTSALTISIITGGSGSGSDSCATPSAIAGQGSFAYDGSLGTTGLEGQTESLCYAYSTSNVNKDLWFAWTADATGPATVSTCAGATFDTKIAAYPGNTCPTPGSALACNDDTCGLQSEIVFNVVSGTTYMLQIGTFSANTVAGPASFDVSIVGPAEPGTAFCFCDGSGAAAPCGNPGAAGNGCANGAFAAGGHLGGAGTALVGSDTVVLSGSNLAPNQPGLYFQGDNAINGGLGVVFGDGIRCAGQNVVRLGVRAADASGNSDTTGITVSAVGGVLPGDLRHYQLWYRDPAGSPCGSFFNLTNGYSIQW
ncbi:MAG: hypothetical protein H6828_13065 [Planctomycetes bacterium]|nr:hypothetical protein [Planctomycetota bacterium]